MKREGREDCRGGHEKEVEQRHQEGEESGEEGKPESGKKSTDKGLNSCLRRNWFCYIVKCIFLMLLLIAC